MLSATRRLDLFATILFLCALTAGYFVDAGNLRVNIPRHWANSLIFAWLLVAFAEWQIFRLSPILVVTHFVLFATVLKLLRQKNNRDWLWLFIVSFCIVLMSAGLMVGTTFLLLLILYLMAAISTLLSFEIRRSQQIFNEEIDNQPVIFEQWREVDGYRQALRPARGTKLFLFSLLAVTLILLIAVPLFFVVPRVSRGIGRNGYLSSEALSGFSDSVKLGEVAQVKLNPQVVMRVRVKFSADHNKSTLRWRGVTLNRYDGQSWNNVGPDPYPLKRIGESFRVDEHQWPRTFTEQQFFMEPLNIRTVFASPRALLVTGLPELSIDLGDGLWTEPHGFHKLNYTVYSDTTRPTDEELVNDDSRDFPRSISQRYLQLPPDHDQRITKLANQITLNAGSQLEIARRIEQHLRTEYGYTLELHQVESGDPVADFLFNAREGHCEYFASAMVLMLRSKRIPARIVNGFQMGEYNSTVDVYTVRQSDAHSWVEVYFPQYKWVAFDPTPPAGLSAYDDGILALLRQYGEAMEMVWMEHVLGFDTSKQIAMVLTARNWMSFYQDSVSWRWMEWAKTLADQAERFQENLVDRVVNQPAEPFRIEWRKILFNPFSLIAIPMAAIASFLLIQRRRVKSWRRQISSNASESAVRFYQEMLLLLEHQGYQRQSHQTPQEFAAEVASPEVSKITRLYQQTRFGAIPLSETDAAQIEFLLGELKRRTGKGLFSKLR